MADLKLSPPPATRPVVCRAATTLPLLMLLVALLLPIRAAAHSHDILKISGCSVSRAGYLEQLTTAFSEATGIRVLLKGGGSMAGLLTLEAGAGDLAASCLPPGAGEIPAGARLVPVAGDALVFIVARNNHLDNLPLEQVRDIFLGRIANWRQLGGPEQPLRRYLYLALPPDPSPAAERFLDFVLSGRGQELLAEIGAIPLAAFGPVPEARQLTIGD